MVKVLQCVPCDALDLVYGKVSICILMEKLLKCLLKERSCWKSAVCLVIDCSVKIGPQGLMCPHPGAIYIYATMIFKHLVWNRLANLSQILCEAFVGMGNHCVYK